MCKLAAVLAGARKLLAWAKGQTDVACSIFAVCVCVTIFRVLSTNLAGRRRIESPIELNAMCTPPHKLDVREPRDCGTVTVP